MEITVVYGDTSAEAVAIQRAYQAFNASNPGITQAQFAQRLVDGAISNLVASYVVAEMDPVQWQRERFTPAERAGIRLAGKTDGTVADMLALLDSPGARVRFTDPLVAQYLDYLVQIERLQPHRPAEIIRL